ncbi:hypothetical protein AOQ87_02100 [Candidatus Riesia pediculischaeffi]|uniref:Uncharacterized protein n=2 Tax=Candidatus Riesia pediculischaeffi TaxID=428411 RepID=A0A1V0HKT9_9ENTR|nr:hypothetical protein AOQ87_02100 [Candidatus Riesia pediculischaeffi]
MCKIMLFIGTYPTRIFQYINDIKIFFFLYHITEEYMNVQTGIDHFDRLSYRPRTVTILSYHQYHLVIQLILP